VIVIIWVKEVQRFHNQQLLPFLEEVHHIRDTLEIFSCCHGYREFNTLADSISKKGIPKAYG